MTDLSIDIRCPGCGYSPAEEARYTPYTDTPETREEVLDRYDVTGADDGCVFCPECATEFNIDTGKVKDDWTWADEQNHS